MPDKSCIDINIDPEVISDISVPGLYELCGMPDSGTTSAALDILDRLADNDNISLYITSIENPLFYSIALEIVRRNPSSIIIVVTDFSASDSLFNLIRYYIGLVDYIAIDNFAHCILNKHRAAITYMADTLKRYAEANGTSIIVVNQMRYQVDPNIGTRSDELMPLYFDYLEPFITKHFIVLKDKIKITVSRNPKFASRSSAPFMLLEDIFALMED